MKTRFLILSDTHAIPYTPPNQYADVALHCGDLTENSTLEEYRSAVHLLKQVNAPIKLAIAGNHDFTLDIPCYKSRMERAPVDRHTRLMEEFGDFGEARRLLEDAGIILLDEGIHRFNLANGASLSIYASPYTPAFGYWGFQYDREEGHEFNMEGVDIAMTHGPPKGLLDKTIVSDEAGCTNLLEAVSKARPKIHCFGHIHEAWGAKLVTWKSASLPTFNSNPVDEEKSALINSLTGARDSNSLLDTLKSHQDQGYYAVSYCSDDQTPIQSGQQTLAINASIRGRGRNNYQLPWLVDIELPKANSRD
ncbi:metallophosphoesterase domain-containing protein 2 [Nannizzia gypsea CBS 118893]|uniref:Metallophosphoesterase domain-containing protein 2 n=1 Tax=Arthroderma gypseum (strain ATCC MYA-4604 / CBS 118893) TaxID=535722 RepID=E4UYT7_ARTGP|nr:metallophosphoesterase domain-containing protein 2 [Nannizzia gypsea CBS 118893]EFR03267.1 metallophosphoesterase domain-containing protein 2 [Nannizzia gypsea CBS 118893]